MESTPQESAEGQAVVLVLAAVLERLVDANAHLAASSPQEETKFHALRAPAIGIGQYLERIHKYASCSKECFVLGLVYVDRLIRRNGLLLTDRCVHRVIITAVLLAAKFFDDSYYNNAYYARVGGVLAAELNALECEFLFKIDFGLRVTPEVFAQYHNELRSHASALGLQHMSHSMDEDLCRPPRSTLEPRAAGTSAQQQQLEAFPSHSHPPSCAITAPHTYSHSEIDPSVYSDPQAQPSMLPTYSQPERAPAVYSNTAPAVPRDVAATSRHPMPQDGSATLLYPAQGVTFPQTSVAQQQQIITSGLDPVYAAFQTLSHQVGMHQQTQTPPVQHTIELDLVGPAPASAGAPQDASLAQYAQYLNQAWPSWPQQSNLPLGATSSAQQMQVYAQTDINSIHHNTLTTSPSIPTYHNTLTTPATAPMNASSSAQYAVPNITATMAAHAYPQNPCFFASTGTTTTGQPSMQRQSYPEITPSPNHMMPPIHVRCPYPSRNDGPVDPYCVGGIEDGHCRTAACPSSPRNPLLRDAG